MVSEEIEANKPDYRYGLSLFSILTQTLSWLTGLFSGRLKIAEVIVALYQAREANVAVLQIRGFLTSYAAPGDRTNR